MDIKKYIINSSKELEIDAIGFTDNNNLDVRELLLERRESKKTTEFEEVDIEKRINPNLTLKSCRSVIVIALSYNVDFKPKREFYLNGKLSMSSWGRDYHSVVNDKIEQLIEKIKEKIDFEYKAFVDTGPLIDRELAKRSGIGYFGKNCSIINKECGSFIFLGYILTDIDLEADRAIEEDCGDCELCLRACPTGALESAYSLNPKKCISYLTQTRENIPSELREKMGNSIYGCDICQMVCPKNKDVKISKHKQFMPDITGGEMDLIELLTISNRNFKKKYGFMSGSWRGRNILKRNAIIALGNSKDKANIELLEETKKDASVFLEEYIEWSIENILKHSI